MCKYETAHIDFLKTYKLIHTSHCSCGEFKDRPLGSFSRCRCVCFCHDYIKTESKSSMNDTEIKKVDFENIDEVITYYKNKKREYSTTKKEIRMNVNPLNYAVGEASGIVLGLELAKQFLHQRDDKWRKGVNAISKYAQHIYNCIRSSFEAGEATKNGYRQKFRDKWYESRPIDKTPKCDCGLDDVINLMNGKEEYAE